jgi:hypothetical protein
MTPKAFELLSLLVENRPRALAKSELHRTLWPSTFVSDATLTSLVAELREALGDHGRERQFIRTVHRFGCAFSAEVSDHQPAAQPTAHTWIVFDNREMALALGAYLIGRDPLSAITLLSPTVSSAMRGSRSGKRRRLKTSVARTARLFAVSRSPG